MAQRPLAMPNSTKIRSYLRLDRHLGIKGKVWLVFGGLTLLTVIGVISGYTSFKKNSGSFNSIVEDRVPEFVALSDLVRQSDNMVALVSDVILAKDEETIRRETQRLTEAENALRQGMAALGEELSTPGHLEQLDLLSARIRTLISTKRRQIEAIYTIQDLMGRFAVLNRDLSLIENLFDPIPQDLRSFVTEANHALTLALDGMSRSDDETLAALEDRVGELQRQLKALPDRQDIMSRLRPETRPLVKLLTDIKPEESPAALVASFRVVLETDQGLLEQREDIHKITDQLSAIMSGWMSETRTGINDERVETVSAMQRSLWMMVLFAVGRVVVGVLIIQFYVVRIVNRMDRQAISMRKIAAGSLGTDVSLDGDDEITDMGRALLVFREAMREVRHLASHDRLTGIGNRIMLESHLDEVLSGKGRPCAVFYINLLGFREINDAFGLDVSDKVLCAVAERLQQIKGLEAVSRIRSDHFVCVLADETDPDRLIQWARRLQEDLSDKTRVDRLDIKINLAIGIARAPNDAQRTEHLLTNANMAMSHAMESAGGDTVALYTDTIGKAAIHRKTIRTDLGEAIENGHIVCAYQPKMCFETNKVVEAEALARWRHPQKGVIPPFEFTSVAERSGLIVDLGIHVLRQACHQAEEWRERHRQDLRVAVNVSPIQLTQSDDFLSVVENALTDSNLPPELLELELTEGVLINHGSDLLKLMNRLRGMGLTLAIDDFGTGYSSLSYLKDLPVQTLKIDRSFVKDLPEAESDMRLVRAMIGMSHDLGHLVVAEGVETLEQLEVLRDAECDLAQGYLISRPLFPDHFDAFIASGGFFPETAESQA